jgi:threonine dehydrogenase-like Zn-dependent dehydrogenase
MRAAALAAPGRASVGEVPMPKGDVLVRVKGCGVCASSLPLWEGRPWFTYPLEPGAPGHEAWGETEDGRRVAFLTAHGFAEWAAVDESTLVELPFDGPFPGEALACAVNVVKRARIEPGALVAIVGMGFLGSAIRQLVDAVEVRRGDAPSGMFDCVIECAGTQSALDTASSRPEAGSCSPASTRTARAPSTCSRGTGAGSTSSTRTSAIRGPTSTRCARPCGSSTSSGS